MLNRSPLFETLHQATRLIQRRLERRIDIHCSNFDIHGYRRLLQDFWGFYHPLERKLVVLADRSFHSPYSQQQRKVPRLRQDLLSLGMTEAGIADLPLCGRLPAIPTLPRALGALYVIGSTTVGGRIADKHVLEKLGINPSRGGSFFSSYDLPTEQYRQEFNTAMSTEEEPDLQILAIEAAVDTFDCFEAWLDYRQRPLRTNYPQWNSASEPKLFPASHVDSISGAA